MGSRFCGRGKASLLAAGLVFWLQGGAGLAADGEIFSAITLKEGLASAMAHNHFITAPNARFTVKADVGAKDQADFGGLVLAFETPVASLVVDDHAQQVEWYPDIEKLGILKEPFSKASDGDRKKIYEAMLEDDQLDGKKYPTVKAELSGITPNPHKIGTVNFTHTGRLAVTAHGKTVTKEAHLVLTGTKSVEMKAMADFKFTEFGIEPFSSFMGAVKVKDPFYLFVATKIER